MNDSIFKELVTLVFTTLGFDCPVMSGNMKQHIKIEKQDNTEAVISISGPSYDIAKWKATNVIEHTGQYDYAISVNGVGAFDGASTKSKHWANKSIVKSCKTLANVYKAEVTVNVEQ